MDNHSLLLLPHFPSMPQPALPTAESLDDFTDMHYPPKADVADIFSKYRPEELVDKALKALQDAGVELIEWLSLLHSRMNVPVIIKDFHYLVPAYEQLDIASKLLAEKDSAESVQI